MLDYVISSLLSGSVNNICDPFGFKGVKKTFNYGIVPAVTLSAHAANHAAF